MKTAFCRLGLTVAFAALTSAAFAGLPEGSFKGRSSLIRNSLIQNDAMAFLIKKDPEKADVYYAVLSEYDRIPFTHFTRKTAITKWVPRMYAYQVEKVAELEYALKPLSVNAQGEIVPKPDTKADTLVLKKDNSLRGAILTRFKKDFYTETAETIRMNGRVGSTWEGFIPGTYYGTDRKSGGDYFNKKINTELTTDGVARFSQERVQGEFQMTEKLPGMFTFSSVNKDNKGQELMENKIAVFIDIVNWKPLMTTDEMLVIDPDDATNVGFYYERH
jgi:hypothetical protein